MSKELQLIQDIYQEYKKNPHKDDELKNELVDKAYEIYKKTGSFGLWSVVFRADRDMHDKFNLLGIKIQAEEAFKNYIEEPLPVLLKMVSVLAHSTIQTDRVYDKEIENVWREVFKSIPDFSQALDKQKDFWKSNWAEQDAKYSSYYAEINREKPEAIEKYTITVPLIVKKENKVVMDYPPHTLVTDAIKNFNSFQLESYMELPFVQKSSLSIISDIRIFNFETSKVLNEQEKNKLLSSLKGQLSDGWGESISQRQELSGCNTYSVGFDYKNAKSISSDEPNKTPVPPPEDNWERAVAVHPSKLRK